jgi:UDP-3-O-[3-hydroxymyristoyl] N-acetylglucosamine deacetylase
MLYQRTIRRPVELTGVGLHTGETVRMELSPAPAGTGVIFRLDGMEIEAVSENVGDTSYATTLEKGRVKVRTVEHLLAALAGLQVDNVYVDLSGSEVPIMDGSARAFVSALLEAGLETLDARRKYLKIVKAVTVHDGDKSATLLPSPVARVTCRIDFNHPLILDQDISLDFDPDSFDQELADARTFGFLRDIEMLEKAGLAKGASLDNAVVVGEAHILNPGGLRYPDEFVRHKALDLLGDLSLAGMPIIAHAVVDKSGHQLNQRLVRKLLAEKEAWMVLEGEPALMEAGLAAAL